jgi:hypothetical protein
MRDPCNFVSSLSVLGTVSLGNRKESVDTKCSVQSVSIKLHLLNVSRSTHKTHY